MGVLGPNEPPLVVIPLSAVACLRLRPVSIPISKSGIRSSSSVVEQTFVYDVCCLTQAMPATRSYPQNRISQ